MISSDPTDSSSNFRCATCGKLFARAALAELEEDLLRRAEAADKSSAEELEALLRECSLGKVGPNSHIAVALKRHLVYVYGRTPGKMLHQGWGKFLTLRTTNWFVSLRKIEISALVLPRKFDITLSS